jgi:K+-sensing histidine kinase KdpD
MLVSVRAGASVSSRTPVAIRSAATTDCQLSAAAHELRLPLSHIKGFVSSLRRSDVVWDEETRKDFLLQIEREADRLA